MKTNNIGGRSKTVNSSTGGDWVGTYGGNKPPPSKILLIPKDSHKPFWFRLEKWLTE